MCVINVVFLHRQIFIHLYPFHDVGNNRCIFMKVKMKLDLKVLSFEGFGTKSLVYSEILDQLSSVTFDTGSLVGDKLVFPNDTLSLSFEVNK